MITTELVGGDLVRISTTTSKAVLALTVDEARELLGDLDAVLPTISHDEGVAMMKEQFVVVGVESGAPCALGCGMPVTVDEHGTYNEVTGFVHAHRKGGGTHQVALRRPTGRVAHAACVAATKKGGTGQQSAF